MNTSCRNCLWTFALGTLLALDGVERAIADNWDGGGTTSEWLDAANWELDSVPMSGDTATILNDTATITGVVVPSVSNLEIGIGTEPGGLSMNGAGNLAMLEVLNEVAVGLQGELEIGFFSAHLLGSEFQNQGDLTVSAGGQITAFQQYIQINGSTILVGGNPNPPPTINAPTMRINFGELSGDGEINGNVRIGLPSPQPQPATISPGIGIGDLAINGDLELATSAEFVVEINASGPIVLADELSVTGTVSLGGTLDLGGLVGTLTPGIKVVFLVAGDVVPGTFFDNIIGTETEGGPLFVGYEPSGGGGVNVYVAAIPEPSMLALVLAGIVGGFAIIRRNRPWRNQKGSVLR